eukprot:TRINITY_DN4949_c0_g1_i1.p1 TRINITY_DN4949_c0_g1~~TRINITY_DN4949_c0_g1_i1.p1  ORF type:complete len:386 (-),score=54.37 TRINITY_DN4949_c0_g1_i1:49-1206(-)
MSRTTFNDLSDDVVGVIFSAFSDRELARMATTSKSLNNVIASDLRWQSWCNAYFGINDAADGNYFRAYGAEMQNIERRWLLPTHMPRYQRLQGHTSYCMAAVIEKDRIFTCSGVGDGSVMVWDIKDQSVNLRWRQAAHTSAGIHCDMRGDLGVSVGYDNHVRTFDVESKIVGPVLALSGQLYCVAMNDSVIVAGDASGLYQIIRKPDPATFNDSTTMAVQASVGTGGTHACMARLCGDMLFTLTHTLVSVYDLETTQQLHSYPDVSGYDSYASRALCVSEHMLIVGTASGGFAVLDPRIGNTTPQHEVSGHPLMSLYFSPQMPIVATGGVSSSSIEIYDQRKWQKVKDLPGFVGIPYTVMFDRLRLVAASSDNFCYYADAGHIAA